LFVAVLSLASLGLLIGAGLAYASVKLHVDVDPRIEKLEDMLPGVNCGACGFPGCNGFAAAIVNDNADITKCAPGGNELAVKIGEIMGREAETIDEKKVAFVYCGGGRKEAKEAFEYTGKKTCEAAVMVQGGQKACQYGCLGYGDCVVSCKFDALKMNENGLPVVDVDKCVACNACVEDCPKDLFKIVTLKEVRQCVCSSLDKGAVAKKVCKVACIGCNICVKNCPYDAIVVNDFLAKIDIVKCTNCGICEEKCPTKAIK